MTFCHIYTRQSVTGRNRSISMRWKLNKYSSQKTNLPDVYYKKSYFFQDLRTTISSIIQLLFIPGEQLLLFLPLSSCQHTVLCEENKVVCICVRVFVCVLIFFSEYRQPLKKGTDSQNTCSVCDYMVELREVQQYNHVTLM